MNIQRYLFYPLFVFVCVIGIFNTNAADGAMLVADGKANSVIVVDPCNTAESAQLAAKELQRHVEMVTGVLIPIQAQPDRNRRKVNIFIGENKNTKRLGVIADNLKSDGFRIVARKNMVVIIGRDYKGPVIVGIRNPWNYNEVYSPKWKIGAFGEAGTLYGVYEFLRQTCGIRWYMPGELGTVVPKKDRLEIGDMDIISYTRTIFCWIVISENIYPLPQAKGCLKHKRDKVCLGTVILSNLTIGVSSSCIKIAQRNILQTICIAAILQNLFHHEFASAIRGYRVLWILLRHGNLYWFPVGGT